MRVYFILFIINIIFFVNNIYGNSDIINNQISKSIPTQVGNKQIFDCIEIYNIETKDTTILYASDFGLTYLMQGYYFSGKYYIMSKYNNYIFTAKKPYKLLKKIDRKIYGHIYFEDILENPITHYKYITGGIDPNFNDTFTSNTILIDNNDNIIASNLKYRITSSYHFKSFFSKDYKYLYVFSGNQFNTTDRILYFYKIDANTGKILSKQNFLKLGNINIKKFASLYDIYNAQYLYIVDLSHDTYEDTIMNHIYIYDIEKNKIEFQMLKSIFYSSRGFLNDNHKNYIVFQSYFKSENKWLESNKCYIYDYILKKVIGEINIGQTGKELYMIMKDKLILNNGYYEKKTGEYTFLDKASHTTYYDTPIELKTYPWEMP